MQLANLQAEFIDSLLSDDTTAGDAHPVSHLQIYRQQIQENLNAALASHFPSIKQLLGNDFFQMTCKHYTQHYPSRQASLNHYGECFCHFLAEYPPVKNLVFLPELAAYEWACHQVLTAEEHTALDVKALAIITPDKYENCYFQFNPACQLFQSHFPLLEIIDYCKTHQEPMELSKGSTFVLLTRKKLEIKISHLDEDDFSFLSSLSEGCSLSQALEEALLINPAFELINKLPDWISQRILVDYQLI